MFLVLIGLIHSLCCYLTFNERYHERWWFIPIGLLFGMSSNGLWFLAAKTIGNKDNLYVFTLFWDGLVVAIYFLMPVLLFGVKLDKIGVLGLGLIVLGTVLIKWKS